MLLPEALGELGRVLLLEMLRRPALKLGERHTERLRRTVRARSRLGEVLLVVALAVVEQLVVIVCGGHLGGDGAADAFGCESRLVRLARLLDELLLLTLPSLLCSLILNES